MFISYLFTFKKINKCFIIRDAQILYGVNNLREKIFKGYVNCSSKTKRKIPTDNDADRSDYKKQLLGYKLLRSYYRFTQYRTRHIVCGFVQIEELRKCSVHEIKKVTFTNVIYFMKKET